MKKRYFIITGLILGLSLNFVPRFVSFLYDEPTWMIETPAIVLHMQSDEASVCDLMGMSVGYSYSGLPAKSYVKGSVCGPDQAVYPLGILINFVTAAALGLILYLFINVIAKRRRTK